MSSHSHRCIIHPQHNQVGVCALCVRERLVALAESESSNVLSSSSTASDGAFHSFSSSSAREASHHHSHSSPPPPSSDNHRRSLKGPSPASSPASFLHKLKLKALISIPPSPDNTVSKNSAGALFSPLPKSKSTNGRKPIASELAGFDAAVWFTPPNVTPNDRLLPPSSLPLGPHLESKASLRSLFNQSEPSASHDTPGFAERTHSNPSDERRRRIEEFSAGLRSPGFAHSRLKADECRQGYENGTEYVPRPHSSWIASLFRPKKQKGISKARKSGMAGDVNAGGNGGAFETMARTSVDLARVSMDSASSLKQIIRARLQQERGEVMKNHLNSGLPPLPPSEQHKMHMNPNMEQPQQPTSNMSNCSYEFPARSSFSISSTMRVSGTRINSTASMGKESNDGDVNVPEQARHLSRSRSWGRARSRGQQLPYSSVGSPQHVLWGSSKQHVNDTTHTNSSVKLSSIQHHYLTSTPKHPAMDNVAPKESRVGFGFYFSPFRRSKRQSDTRALPFCAL